MAKKYFTDESLGTLVSETKSYVDSATVIKADADKVAYIYETSDNNIVGNIEEVLTTSHIIDNLNSTSSATVLSARQGKVLNERINQLSALEEGSTTGDAELIDARIDYNGKTHENVGSHIRSISNQISKELKYHSDKEYGDGIIQSVDGKVISVKDSSIKPLHGMKLFGKTEQFSTTGAQLANLPDIEETELNGIKWSCKNGVVTAKGTSTSSSPSGAVGIYFKPPVVAGTYYISGSKDSLVVWIHIVKDGVATRYVHDNTFTLDGSEKEIQVFCQIEKDNTVDTTVYPMLNYGTSALPYEPYTGGIASPNPYYPQELESFGKMWNLANLPDVEEFDWYGVKWSCKNGVVKAKGTSTNVSSTNKIIWNDFTGLKGKFFVSGSSSDTTARVYLCIIKEDGTASYPRDTTVTLDGTEQSVAFFCQVNAGVTVDATIYPMFNYGTEALAWKPYTGVKEIESEVLGGNIYNGGDIVVNNAYLGWQVINFPVYKGYPTFTVSFKPNGFVGQLKCLVQADKYIDFLGNEDRISIVVTPEYSSERGNLFYSTKDINTINFTDIQIEYGAVATEYEPYNKQTLVTPVVNGLNGLPLGKTIPNEIKNSEIHMQGVYFDEDYQQYYISDTIDYESGKRIQRICYLTLDGRNVPFSASAAFETYQRYLGSLPVEFTSITYNCKVNRLINLASFDGDSAHAYVDKRALWLFLPIDKVTQYGGVSGYFNNCPYEVQFILDTPIETDLTESEIEAYKALHTNYPNTTIINDCDAYMEAEYMISTKKYIDDMHKKYDDEIQMLKNAIISLGGNI